MFLPCVKFLYFFSYSQLYVCDPALELTQRFANMNLPESVSNREKYTLKNIMEELQNLLKTVNPFVKDFMLIAEIPDEDLLHGKLVISAKHCPPTEHERRYNQQHNLNEVSILMDSQPHDLVLHKRGGGLQHVSDLNPSALPLHFTLLFPHGTKGWDSQSTHVDGHKRLTAREYMA